MGTPYMGELRMMSFYFPPQGWAACAGQLLPINQNQALFALLGTMYGGNGQTTFALPDLRGRVPLHVGGGFTQGTAFGEVTHTVTLPEMPMHVHLAIADNSGPAGTGGNIPDNTKRLSGSNPGELYSAVANLTTMSPNEIGAVGGSQAHENRMPYTVVGFCIALQGVFPSRN